MFPRSATKWVWLVMGFAGIARNEIAVAQIGSWPGAPGYGALYSGYSGYRGYETGYPANTDGSRRVYGDGSGFGYSPAMGRPGGVVYYSQPLYPSYRQVSPFLNRPPGYSPRYFDGSSSNRTYAGSSPIFTSPAVTAAIPPVSFDNGEIVLFSPPTNTSDVQYSLNGVSYTMTPGTLQKFANDRSWTIDVNLGNGQHAKYSLSTGRFKFKQAETGMGLYSTQESPEAPAPIPEPDASSTPANDPPAPVPMPVE